MVVHIVTENMLLGDMLKSTCEAQGVDGVTTARSLTEISSLKPEDLVLLHCVHSTQTISQDIEALRSLSPKARIILLTHRHVTEAVQRDLALRVDAIIPDDKLASTLMGALAVVREGYRVVLSNEDGSLDPLLKQDVAPHTPYLITRPRTEGLSNREERILAELHKGRSNKEIAQILGICEATVKVHLRSCFRKIGARNRTQAAIWAASHNVV